MDHNRVWRVRSRNAGPSGDMLQATLGSNGLFDMTYRIDPKSAKERLLAAALAAPQNMPASQYEGAVDYLEGRPIALRSGEIVTTTLPCHTIGDVAFDPNDPYRWFALGQIRERGATQCILIQGGSGAPKVLEVAHRISHVSVPVAGGPPAYLCQTTSDAPVTRVVWHDCTPISGTIPSNVQLLCWETADGKRYVALGELSAEGETTLRICSGDDTTLFTDVRGLTIVAGKPVWVTHSQDFDQVWWGDDLEFCRFPRPKKDGKEQHAVMAETIHEGSDGSLVFNVRTGKTTQKWVQHTYTGEKSPVCQQNIPHPYYDSKPLWEKTSLQEHEWCFDAGADRVIMSIPHGGDIGTPGAQFYGYQRRGDQRFPPTIEQARALFEGHVSHAIGYFLCVGQYIMIEIHHPTQGCHYRWLPLDPAKSAVCHTENTRLLCKWDRLTKSGNGLAGWGAVNNTVTLYYYPVPI